MWKERGLTSCLICDGSVDSCVVNNYGIISGISKLYDTNKYNIMLQSSKICIKCAGRLYQLFEFNHIRTVIDEERLETAEAVKEKSCLFCDHSRVMEEQFKSILHEATVKTKWLQSSSSDTNACYACYNFLLLYSETKAALMNEQSFFYDSRIANDKISSGSGSAAVVSNEIPTVKIEPVTSSEIGGVDKLVAVKQRGTNSVVEVREIKKEVEEVSEALNSTVEVEEEAQEGAGKEAAAIEPEVELEVELPVIEPESAVTAETSKDLMPLPASQSFDFDEIETFNETFMENFSQLVEVSQEAGNEAQKASIKSAEPENESLDSLNEAGTSTSYSYYKKLYNLRECHISCVQIDQKKHEKILAKRSVSPPTKVTKSGRIAIVYDPSPERKQHKTPKARNLEKRLEKEAPLNGKLKNEAVVQKKSTTKCSKEVKRQRKSEEAKKSYKAKKASFACTIEDCGRKFKVRSDLNDHIRKYHTGERPFLCTICNKRFLTGSVYYQHRFTHKGKRFGCEECEKRFYRADALKNHLRIHSGEKPFSCPECHKAFRQRGDRNKHVKARHPEAEAPNSPKKECAKTFGRGNIKNNTSLYRSKPAV